MLLSYFFFSLEQRLVGSDDAGYESLQQHQEAFRKQQQNAVGIDSSKFFFLTT
jgi:hypothetical protein